MIEFAREYHKADFSDERLRKGLVKRYSYDGMQQDKISITEFVDFVCDNMDDSPGRIAKKLTAKCLDTSVYTIKDCLKLDYNSQIDKLSE
jgi:hypothetical protein